MEERLALEKVSPERLHFHKKMILHLIWRSKTKKTVRDCLRRLWRHDVWRQWRVVFCAERVRQLVRQDVLGAVQSAPKDSHQAAIAATVGMRVCT